jgi:excisionase family DNA binding protein
MEVKILQIPESQFNELISKIDRLEENQNRIFQIATKEVLYDSKYIQELLGISQKTLQIFRDRGQIEYIQIGSLVRYKKEAVDKFLIFYSNEVKERR